MRTASRFGLILGILIVIVSAPAVAADHSILGRSLVVRSGGDESSRKVVVVAKETGSDVGALSDPTAAGATLSIEVTGGGAASQSFSLPASGWSAIASGYRYRRAAGASAPVSSVVLKRNARGVATLRVKLAGKIGSDDLEIAPPAPGDAALLGLEVTGGDRYCTGFGGAAGGTERADTAKVWRIVRPSAEAPCPAPAPTPTPTPFCGNGVIESGEQCDGAALGSCEECLTVMPCTCCVPAGSEYFDPNLFRELGCCGQQGFPIGPATTYCGSCLPDGYVDLAGTPPTCGSCCSGSCYPHPDVASIAICGMPPPTPPG